MLGDGKKRKMKRSGTNVVEIHRIHRTLYCQWWEQLKLEMQKSYNSKRNTNLDRILLEFC